MNKILIVFAVVFLTGIELYSYTWNIVNKLPNNQTANVSFCVGINTCQTASIAANQSHNFSFTGWGAGLCLQKIEVNGTKADLTQVEQQFLDTLNQASNVSEGDDEGLVEDFAALATGIALIGDVCTNKTFYLYQNSSGNIYAATSSN